MAKFEEEKVINALHPEKAEVGKRYWFADNLFKLKRYIEENNTDFAGILNEVEDLKYAPFSTSGCHWAYLYPYEEPPKQRMTPRMLSEWLVKGNGQWKHRQERLLCSVYTYFEDADELDKNIVIRSWDSEEWVEPTVDIYERDCKGVK